MTAFNPSQPPIQPPTPPSNSGILNQVGNVTGKLLVGLGTVATASNAATNYNRNRMDIRQVMNESRVSLKGEKIDRTEYLQNAADLGVSGKEVEAELRKAGQLEETESVKEIPSGNLFARMASKVSTFSGHGLEIENNSETGSSEVEKAAETGSSSPPDSPLASVSLASVSLRSTAMMGAIAPAPASTTVYRTRQGPTPEALVFVCYLGGITLFSMVVVPFAEKGTNMIRKWINPKTRDKSPENLFATELNDAREEAHFKKAMSVVAKFNEGELTYHQSEIFLKKCNLFADPEIADLLSGPPILRKKDEDAPFPSENLEKGVIPGG